MFRPIPNYPRYEVDIEGNVRSRGRILKTWNVNGYIYCRIINEDGHYKTGIHRIVAMAWLPQPTEEGLQIDHIDQKKYNNHASNLRWVDSTTNMLNKPIKPRESELHHIIKGHKGCGFVVNIQKNFQNIQKYFPTLEEAIVFRDITINQLNE
jgi:hypothetical protein